jgi:hypothetical protein
MDEATRLQYLSDAQAALHNLLIGQSAVEVAHGGKVVRYTAANIDRLRAYIAELNGNSVSMVKFSTSKGLKGF